MLFDLGTKIKIKTVLRASFSDRQFSHMNSGKFLRIGHTTVLHVGSEVR